VHRLYVFFDLIIVLIFVVIGRSVHDHGVNFFGLLSTAWPFVSGLALGWIIVTKRRHSGIRLRDGASICLVTVALGMLLRVVAGQGTALAFILVAVGFLGALMLLWRIAVGRSRRSLRSPS
jgi:Protein of unknown function (DUF3054)